ncbi:hypothetical protein ABPG75_003209 [Micractinium tetrahymenae]
MALALQGERLMGGLRTGIQPVHLSAASKMAAEYSGMMVQPHKAVVGANAFAHEREWHPPGRHAQGPYKIIRPETIGLIRDCEAGLVLGKHSGRKALGTKLKQMGFDLPAEQLNEVFKRFKALADKKKHIGDEDVLALVNEEVHAPPTIITLVDLQVMCGSIGTPTATVSLKGPDGIVRRAAGMGTGPVDAAYKAIESLSPVKCKLLDYSVSSITEGIDALVCTRVTVKPVEEELGPERLVALTQGHAAERRFHGSGADEDIIMSSARAYISALNKAIAYLAAKKQISTLRKAGAAYVDEAPGNPTQAGPAAAAPRSWKAVGPAEGPSEGFASYYPKLAFNPADGPPYLGYFSELKVRIPSPVLQRWTGDLVAGNGWSDLRPFGNASSPASGKTPIWQLACPPDGGGAALVAYGSLTQLVIKRYEPSADAWASLPVKLTGVQGMSPYSVHDMSLQVSPLGAILLAFAAKGSYKGLSLTYHAVVFQYNASTFRFDALGQLASSGAASGLSLALHPRTGVPHLSYCDFLAGQRATVVRLAPNGTWVVVGPGRGIAGTPPFNQATQLAFGPSGTAYLAAGTTQDNSTVNVLRYAQAANAWQPVCGGPAVTNTTRFNAFSFALGPGEVSWVAATTFGGTKLAVRRYI